MNNFRGIVFLEKKVVFFMQIRKDKLDDIFWVSILEGIGISFNILNPGLGEFITRFIGIQGVKEPSLFKFESIRDDFKFTDRVFIFRHGFFRFLFEVLLMKGELFDVGIGEKSIFI